MRKENYAPYSDVEQIDDVGVEDSHAIFEVAANTTMIDPTPTIEHMTELAIINDKGEVRSTANRTTKQ